MTTDELGQLLQSLQNQIKQQQEIENELRHEIDNQRLQQKALANDNDYLRQKLSTIQFDNSNYSNVQARLETQLYDQEQDNIRLRKEIQQLSKSKKDIEKKLLIESQDYENDKSMWQQREADLYNQMRSLSVNNSSSTPRTPRRRSVTANTFLSPFTSGLTDIGETLTPTTDSPIEREEEQEEKPTPKLAKIDASYVREAKIAQRTIKAQDKLILDLKSELDQQKSALQEMKSEAQIQYLKMVHLEQEISNVKQLNRSLQEDNESYQILLHEKTMNGEFMMNPIMQVDDDPIMKESKSTSSGGLNLAAELASSIPDWNSKKESESIQKLNEEVKTLQDTNRALQLYMNKILMKIINNKQLEDVLSIDQPTKSTTPEPVRPTRVTIAAPGPQPTRTVSTLIPTQNNTSQSNTTTTRQRRRTISYWGNKVPPPPSTPHDSESKKEDEKRRHSSIVQPAGGPTPERSMSTSTIGAGGWAKALRRMSGMGWASAKDDSTTVVNNDSAVGSLNEEDTKKSSGSSTPSQRRSNELGTLDEE